jgi:hypothetical protein
VSRPGPRLPAERRAVASIHAPGRGGAVLAATATDAVRGLAAAAGHSLPASTASNSSGSGGGSDDLVAWIVFALGGIVIVAAWTWSLRTRPLRMRRQRPAA